MSLHLTLPFCHASRISTLVRRAAHAAAPASFVKSGKVALEALQLTLATQDIKTSTESVGLRALDRTASSIEHSFRKSKRNQPSARQLASKVENLRRHKYDRLLPDELLHAACAETRLDIESFPDMLNQLTQRAGHCP